MSRSTCTSLMLASLLLALQASHPAALDAEERVFRSNEFGLALEPIPRFREDEFAWILRVDGGPGPGTETRRLLSSGEERRRWVIVRSADGRREEREYVGEELRTRCRYGAAGELLQEERFSAGELAERTVFQYEDGRLLRSVSYAPDGSLKLRADYLFASTGRLREVRWTHADGTVRSAGQSAGFPRSARNGASAVGSGLAEERSSGGGESLVVRYDAAGRVVARQTTLPEGAVVSERLSYVGDSREPATSVTEVPAERRLTSVTFDAAGAPLLERTTVAGAQVELVEWKRDGEGRPTVRRRTTSQGVEEWRYAYGDDGTLIREEYARRGERVKVTHYGAAGGRVEELYSGGEIVGRVSYEGERRVREEVLVEGEVIRVRVFE